MQTILHIHTRIITGIICAFALSGAGCASSKKYTNNYKIAAEQLRQDYKILQEVLEKLHPSLYWYTSKDSMDACFHQYYEAITDSMTLQEFGFKVLAPVTAQIRCGHTSFNFPKAYNRYIRKQKEPSFPLLMKIWPDTMVVLANLNHQDSILKRGTVITEVNQLTEKELTDSLFKFMPADGYAQNVNYIRLSAAFPYYHKHIFGLSDQYHIRYLDTIKNMKELTIPAYNPAKANSIKKDSTGASPPGLKKKKKEALWETMRNFRIDSTQTYAVMNIHSFGGGTALPSFYRRSFRKLRKNKVRHLVIDVRSNGGGKVNNYTSLARYIKNQPFKVADTVVVNYNKLGSYKKYINHGWANDIVLRFIARKKEDGRYHFRYWERHEFKPRKKNFYDGKVYLLINGPTFSAATLFAHTVKGQSNVALIGEEAGGGWHGNNGILIPDIVLPHSKMRVRLPLFRIIQYQHIPKDGRGVMPDIYVPPSVHNVKQGIDGKMQKAMELIYSGNNLTGNQ